MSMVLLLALLLVGGGIQAVTDEQQQQQQQQPQVGGAINNNNNNNINDDRRSLPLNNNNNREKINERGLITEDDMKAMNVDPSFFGTGGNKPPTDISEETPTDTSDGARTQDFYKMKPPAPTYPKPAPTYPKPAPTYPKPAPVASYPKEPEPTYDRYETDDYFVAVPKMPTPYAVPPPPPGKQYPQHQPEAYTNQYPVGLKPPTPYPTGAKRKFFVLMLLS